MRGARGPDRRLRRRRSGGRGSELFRQHYCSHGHYGSGHPEGHRPTAPAHNQAAGRRRFIHEGTDPARRPTTRHYLGHWAWPVKAWLRRPTSADYLRRLGAPIASRAPPTQSKHGTFGPTSPGGSQPTSHNWACSAEEPVHIVGQRHLLCAPIEETTSAAAEPLMHEQLPAAARVWSPIHTGPDFRSYETTI